MRPIEFRAWDKKNKIMYDDFEKWFIHPETYSIDCGINIGDDITPERNINEFEIMQFIGLYDKHGKKIFELDYIIYNNEIYKIIWSKSKYVLQNILNNDIISHIDYIENGEYYGNYFENLDLLRSDI